MYYTLLLKCEGVEKLFTVGPDCNWLDVHNWWWSRRGKDANTLVTILKFEQYNKPKRSPPINDPYDGYNITLKSDSKTKLFRVRNEKSTFGWRDEHTWSDVIEWIRSNSLVVLEDMTPFKASGKGW